MCILALAWQAHPHWALVVAANRDEFHAREAVPLDPWSDGMTIAGRDLRGGGTWLGLSSHSRFAAVTNVRGFGPPEADRPSRGAIVGHLLEAEAAPDATVAALGAFNPVNAVVVNRSGAWLMTNRPSIAAAPLLPGVHDLSNDPVGCETGKTFRARAAVADWIATPAPEIGTLFEALRAWVPSDPDALFVKDSVYGTRCSTVVAIDQAGRGTIVERSFDAHGEDIGRRSFNILW
ncbi:MAG: NRDE family protein [Sphingomonadales bacterium]